LSDGGLGAGGRWEAGVGAGEDLIARAETDNRGVALVPMSDPSRDISFETAGAARVRLKQLKPKPYAVERADMLVPLGRFFDGTADVELVWLSDAVDFGGGSEFVAALRRLVGAPALARCAGGPAP